MRLPLLFFASALQALSASTLDTSLALQQSAHSSAPVPYDANLFNKDVDAYILQAEFLYWDVLEGSLDYAQKMNQPAWSATTPSYASGKVQTATFDLDPGLRVCVGYFNAPKFYAVRGQYAHLITRGKDSVEPPRSPIEYLTGTWPTITTLPVTHAHSNIFFNYNVFDLVIDRVFITNPHLRLRLSGGGTVCWIEQDWKIQYFDGTGLNTTVRNRWRFTGGGLSLGVISDWYWGNNIYLTGVAKSAVYIGSYHNRNKQTSTFQPTGTENTTLPVANSDYSDARPSFTAQFSIGPSWQQNYSSNRVEVFVGYEMNIWFNLQEMRRSSGGVPTAAKETWLSNSILALQGLTTRLTTQF